MKIPLVGQSYTARSLTVAAQTCINAFPELIQDPNERNKNKAALYGCPGRHLFKNLTAIDAAATPVRGVWSGGGRCFVAAGTKYFEISSAGALIGSVRTISNASEYGLANSPVQFFPNGNQLFIIAGGVPYIDNGAGPVAVTVNNFAGRVNTVVVFGSYNVNWVSGDKFDPSMAGGNITINGVVYVVAFYVNEDSMVLTTSPGAQSNVAYTFGGMGLVSATGGFLDGYYIADHPYSREYNISAVNNKTGPLWNNLDRGSKDSWPDNTRSVLVNAEQLFLFGEDSFDVHHNTGAASFPFERIEGASGRWGSASPWGPISIEGTVYFVAQSSGGGIIACAMDGFTPKRISTHGEESQWNALGLGANCVSYWYREEGHTFWVINFGLQTWAFEVSGSGAWHRRNAWAGAYSTYQTQYHTFIPEWGTNGKHITGGPLDGSLYESSVNFYDDAGGDMHGERALCHLYNENKRMYFNRLEIEMETGTVASGAAPSIYLDYSDDRGHTWSTPEAASMGVHNAFTQRVYWTALGSSYDRVFRLSWTGQSKIALVDADLEMELGIN